MIHKSVYTVILFLCFQSVWGQKLVMNTINKAEDEILKKKTSFYYNSNAISNATQRHLDEILEIFLKEKNKNMILYIKCDSDELGANVDDSAPIILSREKAVIEYLTSKGLEAKRIKSTRNSKFSSRNEVKKYGSCRCLTFLYDIV